MTCKFVSPAANRQSIPSSASVDISFAESRGNHRFRTVVAGLQVSGWPVERLTRERLNLDDEWSKTNVSPKRAAGELLTSIDERNAQ